MTIRQWPQLRTKHRCNRRKCAQLLSQYHTELTWLTQQYGWCVSPFHPDLLFKWQCQQPSPPLKLGKAVKKHHKSTQVASSEQILHSSLVVLGSILDVVHGSNMGQRRKQLCQYPWVIAFMMDIEWSNIQMSFNFYLVLGYLILYIFIIAYTLQLILFHQVCVNFIYNHLMKYYYIN